MQPVERTPGHDINTNTDCHFKRTYDDRILNIYLEIRRQGEEWEVNAKTTLEFTKGDKPRKVVCQSFRVGNDDDRWIGSWDYPYLKPACRNMAGEVFLLDETPSTPDNILPEELGRLSDHALVDITGGVDFVFISSNYLREISETPVE